MMRRRIIDAINQLDVEQDDTSEMVDHLARTYNRSVIDQIIREQDPPLIVVDGRVFVLILDSHPERWVKVAEKVNREIRWSGNFFHDLLIDLGLNAAELDRILDDIIISWRPLI